MFTLKKRNNITATLLPKTIYIWIVCIFTVILKILKHSLFLLFMLNFGYIQLLVLSIASEFQENNKIDITAIFNRNLLIYYRSVLNLPDCSMYETLKFVELPHWKYHNFTVVCVGFLDVKLRSTSNRNIHSVDFRRKLWK